MERVARGFDTEPIQRGLARIPPRILERVGHVDFLLGADPVFVGLHSFPGHEIHGVSLRSTPHCSYGYIQDRPREDRVTTIVIPIDDYAGYENDAPMVVIHEAGHALHEVCGFEPWPAAVSSYAESTRWEAFAEAFAAWLYPELYPWAEPILKADPVLPLFEELAR